MKERSIFYSPLEERSIFYCPLGDRVSPINPYEELLHCPPGKKLLPSILSKRKDSLFVL